MLDFAHQSSPQKPDLVQVDTQIQHSERKRGNAEREHGKVEQEAVKQREQLRVIKSDLDKVVKAANAAQGRILLLP